MKDEWTLGFRDKGLVQSLHQAVEAGLRGQVHADLEQDHGFSLQACDERGIAIELIQSACCKGKLCFNQQNVCGTSHPEVRDMELAASILNSALGDKGKFNSPRPVSDGLLDLSFIP